MSDVLYIPQMAQKIGRTETALRSLLQREAAGQKVDLPPSFMLGGKRAWRLKTVERWLEEREQAAIEKQPKKRGRPRQGAMRAVA